MVEAVVRGTVATSRIGRWLVSWVGAASICACSQGPRGIGPLDVVVRGEEAGWLLTTVIPPSGAAVTGIVDRDGRWLWWEASDPEVFPMSARVGRDGRSVLFGEFEPTNRGEDRGRAVQVVPATGERVVTRLRRGHHDLVEHADGTLGFLSLHTTEVGLDHPLGFDRIDEVATGSTADVAPRVVYDTFTASPIEPYAICSHIERSRPKFGERVFEWTHANSLMWSEEEDAYYVNAKWTDWVVKVDRASGAPIWVMNGDGGDFVLADGAPAWSAPDDSALWSHGHMSQVWLGGFMMFDNGLHHPEGVSALVRIEYDEVARVARRAWSFPHPDGAQTQSMGDAKRLPSGNVLGSWADLAEITEVDERGDIVWHARGPEGSVIGRTTWLSSIEGLLGR